MQPNVVVIVSHDTGRLIAPYGLDTVRMPNFDRFAAEGVVMEQAFCTAPQCSPSRAGLFTGRAPHCTGTLGLTHGDFGWGLNDDEQHAAELFADAGYESWLAFQQHETDDPTKCGYERIVEYPHGAHEQAPGLLDEALAERDTGRPMFLQMGFFLTHRPFEKAEPQEENGVYVPPYLADGPATRDEMARFQRLAEQYDTCIGRVMDVLKQHDLVEDTIIVLTTDHGIAMPLAKGTLYDPGLETYLMLRCPERWAGGTRHQALVSNIDVLPTLLEACGIAVPERIQGRSFLPLLEGGDYEPNEAIFAEKTFHGCYDPMRGVRTGRYKYIRFFEKSGLHPVPGDIAFHGAYREMPPERYRRTAPEELYDLESDPNETNNLADSTEHGEVLEQLRTRLARWMQATDDPLLDGPVASPYFERAKARMRDLL